MYDHDSSSSGLMIGLIVGGGVVLVLVVLAVIGGAFFWTMEAAPVIAPVAALINDDAEPVPPVEVAPAPAIKVANPRQRLLGVWEAKTKNGGTATMEFRADGSLQLNDKQPDMADIVQPPVRWEVREGKDGLKISIGTVQGGANDHVLRFLDEDRIVIDTIEARTYERRKVNAPKK